MNFLKYLLSVCLFAYLILLPAMWLLATVSCGQSSDSKCGLVVFFLIFSLPVTVLPAFFLFLVVQQYQKINSWKKMSLFNWFPIFLITSLIVFFPYLTDPVFAVTFGVISLSAAILIGTWFTALYEFYLRDVQIFNKFLSVTFHALWSGYLVVFSICFYIFGYKEFLDTVLEYFIAVNVVVPLCVFVLIQNRIFHQKIKIK